MSLEESPGDNYGLCMDVSQAIIDVYLSGFNTVSISRLFLKVQRLGGGGGGAF